MVCSTGALVLSFIKIRVELVEVWEDRGMVQAGQGTAELGFGCETGYFRPPYQVNSNLTGHYTGGWIAQGIGFSELCCNAAL